MSKIELPAVTGTVTIGEGGNIVTPLYQHIANSI